MEYETAFNSVETSAVMQALRNQDVDEHNLRILEDSYNGSTATIVLHKESSKIPIAKGVKQGDNFSNVIHKMFTRGIQNIGLDTGGRRG